MPRLTYHRHPSSILAQPNPGMQRRPSSPLKMQGHCKWRGRSKVHKPALILLPPYLTHLLTSASMVSATPTVDDEAVYFVDWNGGLYKADRYTGEVLWFRQVGPLFGQLFSATRSSPALSGDRLVINSMVGARVAAVRKSDGTTIWSTNLPVTTAQDSMTNSPMIHNGVIYTSTMCGAEQCQARNEGYECCRCVGQLFALSLETGEILWSTKTLPERCDGFADEATCVSNCEAGEGFEDCEKRCAESCR